MGLRTRRSDLPDTRFFEHHQGAMIMYRSPAYWGKSWSVQNSLCFTVYIVCRCLKTLVFAGSSGIATAIPNRQSAHRHHLDCAGPKIPKIPKIFQETEKLHTEVTSTVQAQRFQRFQRFFWRLVQPPSPPLYARNLWNHWKLQTWCVCVYVCWGMGMGMGDQVCH